MYPTTSCPTCHYPSYPACPRLGVDPVSILPAPNWGTPCFILSILFQFML